MAYIVDRKSRLEIRTFVNEFRKDFNLDNVLYFPIDLILDVFTLYFADFSYEVVADDGLKKNIHAETDILNGHIVIKESVYNRACLGYGRDRMTIAHELGHYLLHYCLEPNIKEILHENYDISVDPEWQAKCFAGELLIPKDLVIFMTPSEIAEKCGVSLKAAQYQKNIYLREDKK